MRRLAVQLMALGSLVAGLAAANARREREAVVLDWWLVRPGSELVVVEQPTRGAIARRISARGVVEPVRETGIRVNGVGGRVVEVAVRDGDRVKQGDLLLRLDSSEPEARQNAWKARREALGKAIAAAVKAQEAAVGLNARYEQYVSQGVAIPPELTGAPERLAAAQRMLEARRGEAAEADRGGESAGKDVKRCEIRATMDGEIDGLAVGVGDVLPAAVPVVQAAGPILTIFDPDRLHVKALVDEADVALVRPEQPAWVVLPTTPMATLEGRVERVSGRGRAMGDVVGFAATIDVGRADERLRAGMRVIVEVEVSRAEEAVGLPVQAVLQRKVRDLPETPTVREWLQRAQVTPGRTGRAGAARYARVVFVIEKGTARLKPIETGLTDERRVEVAWGLEPGEKVIVGPFRTLDELKDGDPVTVEPERAGAAK